MATRMAIMRETKRVGFEVALIKKEGVSIMLNIEETKREIVDRLKPLMPEKIILFGSYAYGEPKEDSDLDICVVEKTYKNRWDEKSKIRKLLSGIKIGKDILVPYLEEYEFYRKEINSVYNDIDLKGEVLWQKNS